ncbi:MAG TPA: hypothetical protein VF861_13640 [Telluria sp.]
MRLEDCTRCLANRRLPARILVLGLLSAPAQAGTEAPDPLDPLSAPAVRPAPRLDIDIIKALVREDVRDQMAGPITEPGELARLRFEKSGFANAVKNAKRPACQTRYASLGLLVVIPLLIDTARGSGCKW